MLPWKQTLVEERLEYSSLASLFFSGRGSGGISNVSLSSLDFSRVALTDPRELEGLRCTECGKGASDIAGRPTSGSSTVFLNIVVAGLGDSLCKLSPFFWMRLGRFRSGRDAPPAEP
eukprot:3062300-Amphidinium_carterae.1